MDSEFKEKKYQFKKILSHFYKDPKHHPKRENIHTSFIRSIKRLIRYVAKGKSIPSKTNISINTKHPVQVKCWNNIQILFLENPKFLTRISNTKEEPQKPENSEFKSHNLPYCQYFFESTTIKQIFCEFLDLMFSKFDVKSLSERFGFSCCPNSAHDDSCLEKWNKLKDYLYNNYIEDLYSKGRIYSNNLITEDSKISEENKYVEDETKVDEEKKEDFDIDYFISFGQ